MQPKIDYEYGDYTYGVPKTNGEGELKIGKFCSIAEDVKFILWGHKINLFSTYPFGHTEQTKDMSPSNDHLVKGKIVVGNDVWIGDGATITYGVTIGDGAVISAKSYVTKNVKPYTVVGGNPAEFLFTRFSKDVVDILLKLKWWDLPHDVIKNNINIMTSNNVEELKAFYKISKIDEIVNKSFDYHQTQQNKWEYGELLKKLIQYRKTESILEIGAKYGGTTYGFCNTFDKVVSIDIFKEEQINELEKTYNNLTFILGDSHAQSTKDKLNGMKFDVIYIDAEHNYDGVKQDYLDYKEFIKDDGIIVFHDIKRTSWTDDIGIQVPLLWEEIKNDYNYEELINNDNDCYGIGLLFKKNIEREMKILVFSCCFNEEHMLPFYLDYYSNFIGADKIVIVDGGSSDRSQDIIKANSKTELIIDVQEKLDDRHLNDLRNDGWKPYRDQYDWVIVCDIDEFIYHPNLKEKLKEYDENGITIPLTEGYDMISKKFPKFEEGKYLPDIVNRGVRDSVFLDKKSIFKSSIDINYHIGSHGCDPIGSVKYSDTRDIKHLHFKWVAHKYMTRRSAGVADRLSDWNLSGGCGSHNRPFSLTSISDFNKRCDFQSVQVIGEENKTTPLYAFSHNYLVNNWNYILDNQLRILKESGLYDEITTLFMYVHGDDKEFNKFQGKVNSYDNLFRINIVRIEENFFEYPTLQALYEFVKIENAYILYFHLKGVWSVYNSTGNRLAIDSWRECLEYFNIEKWRDCVKKLDEGYEVVGALYNYNEKEPLFSGNFWWANSKYIKKLPKLEYVKENDPDPDEEAKTWCRVECEKWINRIPNKFYNFYIPKDYGFYYMPIDTKDYKEKSYYKISVLIPTYNRFNLLKDAIQSVLDQNYDNFEILVCHDGPSDEYNKFKEDNKNDKIFYYEVPRRNNYGAAQRNFMLEKVTGDYILHLDDDNIIYPGYFDKMIAQIDNKTGMVICRIHYNDKEWTNYVLPLADRIQDCEIDQLGILFKADIGKMFTWDDYFGHDHRYIKACENVINAQNLKIKYIPDVLASHRFFGEVIPRIVIVHHCYLRYGWKDILEEQIFLMKNNGLYEGCTEIFATIYADDKNNIKEFRSIIEQEDTLKKWKIIELQQNNYEYDALKHLKKYSEDKHAYICYFHLKGVISKEIDPNVGIPTWRKYLNYFTINKWKENIEHLKDNDIVCVDWNFNDMHQKYVLGGHFFWTKSAYIRTLREPENNENRFLSEIWITSNPNVKIHENFNYEKIGYKNLYLQWFQPLIYRTDHEEYANELVSWSFRKYGEQENKYEYKDFIKGLMINSLNQSILEIGSKYYGSTYCFCNMFDKIVLIDKYETEQIKKLNKEYNNFSFILEDKDAKDKVKGMKFDVLYLRNEYKDCLKEDTALIFHDFKYKEEEPVVIEPVAEPIKFVKPKTVYIITSHPNYKMSEDITKKTLENIRTFGEKVILSAHCPVSPDIQRLADYFVYDKNNPLIKHDFYTNSWFPHDDYHAHLNITKEDNNFNHALGVFLNYYNSLILAKSQGFNTAVCTNFDMVFSAEDKKIIDERIYKMRMEGKKAFFMRSKPAEGVHYKTIFFITDVDYFINTFKYIANEKLYTEEMQKVGSNTNCLENFVYHSLKNKTNDLLLEEINEEQLFPTSQINLFSLIEYNTILPVENEPDKFIIWFSSANSLDSRDFNIAVRKNGNIILTDLKPIDKKFIYYKKVKFTKGDNFEINFRVINGNEVLKNKIIRVNDEVFNDIKSYGNFIDRKNIESI